MDPQQPVIRTYRARERAQAEEAYRLDAENAQKGLWFPVAHRWVSSWAGEELSVVFEHRPDGGESASESHEGLNDTVAEARPLSDGDWTADQSAGEDAGKPAAEGLPEHEPVPERGAALAAVAAAPTEPAAPIAQAAATADGNSAEPEAAVTALPVAETIQTESTAEPQQEQELEDHTEAQGDEVADSRPWAAAESDETTGESLSAERQGEPWTEYELAPEEAPADEYAATPDQPWTAEQEPQPSSSGDQPPSVETTDTDAAFESAEAQAANDASKSADWITPIGSTDTDSHTDAAVPAPTFSPDMPAIRGHARALVQALDLHTAGEPLRLIRSGFPAVPSLPVLERRQWLKDHADFARRVLMWEPRGHRDMYGAILLPPYRDDADICALFMHNEGYSTMCGHGIIAIATALVEEGLYPATLPETVIRFETPAGLVTATAQVERTNDGRHEVSAVRFQNVPAYLHERGIEVHPDGVELAGGAASHGALLVDLAFGGAYYGIVNAADLGLRVVPEQAVALTRAGAAITDALRRDHAPTHPTEPDLGFVYGTIIVDEDPASSPDGRGQGADLRNVTVFADEEVDRSPCGSGTSALLARLHAAGELAPGARIVNAGITGEAFHAWIDSTTRLGDHDAVVTSVEGRAFVTGYHTFVIDDRDPLGNGFLLA